MQDALTMAALHERSVCTISEAAQILGVGRVVIRAAIKEGSVPVLLVGRKQRVSVPALLAMLDRGVTA
jgi:excisionase family DNA binding protein